jgi:hypothetical protein
MAELFDDLARIFGSGLSRREALRMALITVAGSYLGIFWPATAEAQDNCRNRTECSSTDPLVTFCDFDTSFCCPSERGTDGVRRSRQCCGSQRVHRACLCCPPSTGCCESNKPNQGDVFECCGAGEICCNKTGKCCPPAMCCGKPGQEACCKNICEACDPVTMTCKDTGRCKDEKVNTKCCPKLDGTGSYCCAPDVCCGEDRDVCGSKSKKKSASRIAAVTATEMTVVVQDDQGVGTITVVKAVNAQVSIASFPPGTTDPILVTATKDDAGKRSSVELKYCAAPGCGCETCCGLIDPVLTTLQVPAGEDRIRQAFGQVPETEGYLTVQNGSPGLEWLRVNVNGRRAAAVRLRESQVRMLDLGRHMVPGANLVTITGFGEPESSALVLLADTPAVGRIPGSAVTLPRIAWEAARWQPGADLQWGR